MWEAVHPWMWIRKLLPAGRLLLGLPSENQADLEERWKRSTVSGNASLYAVFLGFLSIQSLSWKTAPCGYWGMMTIKGRIAVRPSAVCSLCGRTMTTSPEANHWSDLSNIRTEALDLGQVSHDRHSKRAQLFLGKNNQWPLDNTGLKQVVNAYFVLAESSTAGIRRDKK